MKRPPYLNFPTVTNGTITLRAIKESDLKDLVEISFYDAKQAENVEMAAEMQDKIDTDYIEGNSIHWGITENSTNKVVGTCGYYRGFKNAEGELGCVLLPQSQGKGYMTQTLSLAIDFGFKEIGLQRIWAVTDRDNHQAGKLLERLNLKKVNNPDLNENEVEFELRK